jgi:hypothetical protein
MVSTILGVFGSYILPTMFGLSGTMIAVIRKIQDQFGKSELHPRDFLLMQLLTHGRGGSRAVLFPQRDRIRGGRPGRRSDIDGGRCGFPGGLWIA